VLEDSISHAQLDITGTLNKPIRSTTTATITVYGAAETKILDTKPPSLAVIRQFRPSLQIVLFVNQHDFDRLWTWALADTLKHARLLFTEPRFHKAHLDRT
jgi:hypothetical protein